MSVEEYIEIRPEFTVDKYTDHAAPTAKPGSFPVCDNYIPMRGRIESRLGITVLAHTPDTSWVIPWDPENPIYSASHTTTPSESEFARCRVILKFESQTTPGLNALTGNNLYNRYTGYGGAEASMVTSYYGAKQGTYSLYLGSDTAIKSSYQSRDSNYNYGLWTAIPHADAAIYNMPGQSGVETRTCLVSFWCYIPSHAHGGSNFFFTFGNGSVGDNSFQARYWLCGSQSIRYQWSHNNTSWSTTTYQTPYYIPSDDNYLSVGVWHFLAFWVDGAKKNTGFYHYNASTGYEFSQITTVGSTYKLGQSSARQTIGPDAYYNPGQSGNQTDVSNQIHAAIDYWTMWDSLYTNYTSNVTLCRDIKNLHA